MNQLLAIRKGIARASLFAVCLAGMPAQAVVNHVYVLTGQSNSLGAVKGSPATPAELEQYRSKGLLWNGNMHRDTGVKFDPDTKWKEVAPQLPDYNGGLCMGPEYGFCSMMQRRGWHTAKGNRVCVIKASLDGGGNTHWTAGSPSYASLVTGVRDGFAALKGKSVLRGLLYLQGESDSGAEITEAPQRFRSLMSRLPKDAKQPGLKNAVLGECASWAGKDKQEAGKTSVQLMRELADKEKNISWVRTRDLPKLTKGDNMQVHYSGTSQLSIGARFAYAVAVLEKLPLPGCVRSDDRDAALESPRAWWGSRVAKAEKVMRWDISAPNTEEKLGASLATAGIVVEDPPVACCVVHATAPGASVAVGKNGIELQNKDLTLLCDVSVTADQTWKLSDGRTLTLGAQQAPVLLQGNATVTLNVPPGSKVQIYLREPTQVQWQGKGDNVRVVVVGK